MVDLPGDERPTGVQFLGDGGLAISYRLRDRGGLHLRTLQGAPWTRPDVAPENDSGGEGVALSPDGTMVAVAHYGQVQIVPLGGEPTRFLGLGGSTRGQYCWSPWRIVWGRPGPQGTLALQCALGAPMALLDVQSGALRFPMPSEDAEHHQVTIRGMSLSPDGATLVVMVIVDTASGEAPRVELRALPDGALRKQFALSKTFGDGALSPDNTRIAVSSPYWGFQVLDAESGRVLVNSLEQPDERNSGSGDVRWSPDGALLYRVGLRLGVAVHDARTGALRGYLPSHRGDLPDWRHEWPDSLARNSGHLTLSPDGRYLASVSRADISEDAARAVRVWRLPPSSR